MSNNNNKPVKAFSVKQSATKEDTTTTTTTMSAPVMSVETLMSQGVCEEMAKMMIATMNKEQGNIEKKQAIAKEFTEWKKSSGYDKAMAKIEKKRKELEELEAKLPPIPEKFQTSKTRGAIGGEKKTATWKGENRSKHSAEELKKQNIKDANWVLNSVGNIACENGNGTSGSVETKFTKLYEHMKEVDGKIEDRDFSKELALVKPSTYTTGCRYMCRKPERMAKHIAEECKFQCVDGKYSKKE